MWADVIVVQGLVNPRMISDLWAYKVERGKKIIVDRDDVFQVQDDNPFGKMHKDAHANSWSQDLVKMASLVTVTTPAIREECLALNKSVVMLPNYLDMEVWDTPSTPNESGRIRIGWTGSITHRDDVRMLLPLLYKIALSDPRVQLVFCGDNAFIKDLSLLPRRSYEFVGGTGSTFYAWPALAHTLSLDIGVAPLRDTSFNRARSAIKYLEYSMCDVPGVYSNVAYSTTVKHGETGYIAHTLEEWETYLHTLITYPLVRETIRKEARKHVRREYDIKRHITDWIRQFKALSGVPAAA